MDLEVPVLARDIPGNAAVVQHEVTGLLYSSPQVHNDKPIQSPNAFTVLCTEALLTGSRGRTPNAHTATAVATVECRKLELRGLENLENISWNVWKNICLNSS